MIAEKLSDIRIPHLKEIKGRGKILVPEIIDGVPTGKFHEIREKNSIGFVPLNMVHVFDISRKSIVRMARSGEIYLYDWSGKRLDRDDKTNITKYVNYYDL